jgi:hypothetical protein
MEPGSMAFALFGPLLGFANYNVSAESHESMQFCAIQEVMSALSQVFF